MIQALYVFTTSTSFPIKSSITLTKARLITLVMLVQVLAGVHIMFSRVIPLQDGHPEWHPMWRKAVKFGATCTTQPSDAVTHVAAYVNGTEKVCMLLQPFVAFSGL